MSENLKQKAISGVVWSAIHKFSSVFLGFVSGIVLARLLTPHDYGVIGMLTIFLAISQTFIDGGFGSALIQKKNPSDEDYSTILYWNLGLSLFLYLVLYACAPYIAKFYSLPILCDVLRVQGIVLIINAARIVQHNQLRKKLQFKKVAIINFTASTIALCVTIYLAWKGWGVWALVAQQLLVGFLATIFYWANAKWQPKFCFSKKSFKELFGFGGFILLSNLFNTFCNNIQGLLIGKVYNSSTLGYYTKAKQTEEYASTFISSVLDQVSFPVLSEAQDSCQRMTSILKKFISTSAYITFPLMMLLIVLAKPIVIILYSERWLPCVPYFQILCLAGIASCLQNINYFAVAAIGKSKQLFTWTFVKRGLGLAFVVGGLWIYGIYGLLIGSVVTSWLIYFINAGLVSKYIGYTIRRQFIDLFPIITLSLTAFAAVCFLDLFTKIDNLLLVGLIKAALFVLLYIILSLIGKIKALAFAIETTKTIVKRIKHTDQ